MAKETINRPPEERKVAPFPAGMIDEKAVREATRHFYEAYRKDQFGPWTTEELEDMYQQRKQDERREREGLDLLFDSQV